MIATSAPTNSGEGPFPLTYLSKLVVEHCGSRWDETTKTAKDAENRALCLGWSNPMTFGGEVKVVLLLSDEDLADVLQSLRSYHLLSSGGKLLRLVYVTLGFCNRR